MSTKQKALCYLRSNMDCEELAYHIIASKERREPIDCHWEDTAHNLLEEFGDDYELPEGWWREEGDIEDWLHMVIG